MHRVPKENLIIEVIKLGIKYDLILNKEGIQYPPSQERMASLFGSGSHNHLGHATLHQC